MLLGKLADNDYLVPQKWNQGCYDFVRLLPGYCVQFVQVTLARTHKLKVKYMIPLLEALVKGKALVQGSYKVKKIEAVFLVSSHNEDFVMPTFMDKLPEPYKQMFQSTTGKPNCCVRIIKRFSDH